MANSRRKGNKNERRAVDLIKGWTKKDFSRVPRSGGLGWKVQHAKGDITCTQEGHYFPFCIEVKAHKDINFSHLLYDVDSKVMEFWAQCVRDAYIAKKIPMLLMRYNGLPKDLFFLVIPREFFIKLIPNEMGHINRVMHYRNAKSTLPIISIISSRAFFKSSYKGVRKIALKYLKSIYGKKAKAKKER